MLEIAQDCSVKTSIEMQDKKNLIYLQIVLKI